MSEIKPGSWVINTCGDKIALVKNVWPEHKALSLAPTFDLVFYGRDGQRIGRESPAMGGPKGFEPCCDSSAWVAIQRPSFPFCRSDYLHRRVSYLNQSEAFPDDGRL